MYEYLIGQYIKNLTIEDIILFAKEKNVTVSKEDATLLLKTAKEHWITFYKGDPSKIIAELKKRLDPTTFELGIELWMEYKKKLPNG